MSLADRIIYQPPTEGNLTSRSGGQGVTCERCGGTDIRRYPITWSRGPRIVTKCQDCYTAVSVERPTAEEPWPPFRAVAYDWEVSAAERPSVPGSSAEGRLDGRPGISGRGPSGRRRHQRRPPPGVRAARALERGDAGPAGCRARRGGVAEHRRGRPGRRAGVHLRRPRCRRQPPGELSDRRRRRAGRRRLGPDAELVRDRGHRPRRDAGRRGDESAAAQLSGKELRHMLGVGG